MKSRGIGLFLRNILIIDMNLDNVEVNLHFKYNQIQLSVWNSTVSLFWGKILQFGQFLSFNFGNNSGFALGMNSATFYRSAHYNPRRNRCRIYCFKPMFRRTCGGINLMNHLRLINFNWWRGSFFTYHIDLLSCLLSRIDTFTPSLSQYLHLFKPNY